MKHKRHIQSESERPYQNRNYILHELDDEHFTRLNFAPKAFDANYGYMMEVGPTHLIMLNGYCLDALDELPAGGMQSSACGPFQLMSTRGMTLAELEDRAELARKLLAELK